jgi:threonine dehydratase
MQKLNKMFESNSNPIEEACIRISKHLIKTPILRHDTLNQKLGHDIYLKLDSNQITGAFKVRAVLNHLLILKEQGALPEKIVGYTTGNHGVAMGYAAQLLNIKARIYVPSYVSNFKANLITQYPVELIYTDTREEAEERTKLDSLDGFYYLHPSNSDYSIWGAGTMCFEALTELDSVDAIFASCGGGGLLSGSFLAKEILSPKTLIFGSEPEQANDAYISVKSGEIFKFSQSPDTIADGLKTLAVSNRCYNYLKKLDDIFLVKEDDILYWTNYCYEVLKIETEPSCAINIAAAASWLKGQARTQKILILISGKNYDYKANNNNRG